MQQIKNLNIPVMLALTYVLVIVIVGLFAALLAPHSPQDLDVLKGVSKIGPFESSENILGVDRLGRDMLSRLIYGARIEAFLGLGCAIFAILLAIAIIPALTLTKYYRNTGLLPHIHLFTISYGKLILPLLFCFGPGGLIVVVQGGAGIQNVLIASAPIAALLPFRMIYTTVQNKIILSQSTKHKTTSDIFKLCAKSILPMLPMIYALALLTQMPYQGFMSFLGVGVPPGTSAWGIMVSEGRDNLVALWWLSWLPLALILIGIWALVILARTLTKLDPNMGSSSTQKTLSGQQVDKLTRVLCGFAEYGLLQVIILPWFFPIWLCILIWFSYLAVFVGGYKRSLACRWYSVQVKRIDETSVTIGQSVGRAILVMFLHFFIGFVTVPFSKTNQTLWDKMTGTVLVSYVKDEEYKN